MSGRSFRSVLMVASCAGAALGCYLVSLRVASERAALEEIETKIVLAQRDIRLLQTEVGTRGRLAQLEKWNVKVLALSAPSADQFLDGGFALARLVAPQEQPQIDAPVVLASAPAPQRTTVPLEEGERRDNGAGATAAPAQLLHQASLKVRPVEAAAEPAQKPSTNPAAAKPQPAKPLPVAKAPVAAKAEAKAPAKKEAAAKPEKKPAKLAEADPLAPLPARTRTSTTSKESGTAR